MTRLVMSALSASMHFSVAAASPYALPARAAVPDFVAQRAGGAEVPILLPTVSSAVEVGN